MALLRSYLFAPGHDPKLLDKVFAAGADAVVLDLEDAVPPGEKDRARELVGKAVRSQLAGARKHLYVRLNAIDGAAWPEDVDAVVHPALAGVRIPKAESADQVRRVEEALGRAESARGLAPGSVEIVCTIESAAGVLAARELAGCPRVRNLLFGAADFAGDVGAEPGPEETETLLARSQLVLASRAAGIDPPVASVHTRLEDDKGLKRTTEAARRLGFFGRSLIHPRQIAIVHEVFTPRPKELQEAREMVQAFEAAGSGATTRDGQFLDAAVVRRARALLALAESLSAPQGALKP